MASANILCRLVSSSMSDNLFLFCNAHVFIELYLERLCSRSKNFKNSHENTINQYFIKIQSCKDKSHAAKNAIGIHKEHAVNSEHK